MDGNSRSALIFVDMSLRAAAFVLWRRSNLLVYGGLLATGLLGLMMLWSSILTVIDCCQNWCNTITKGLLYAWRITGYKSFALVGLANCQPIAMIHTSIYMTPRVIILIDPLGFNGKS